MPSAITDVTRRTVFTACGLLAIASWVAPTPAAAQQEWRNPYTGRIWNNPHSSLMDTFLHNDQQRRIMMHHYGRDPGAQPHPLATPVPAPSRGGGGEQRQQHAASRDPSFRVINRGPVAINEIYVSSSQVNHWGPDRLGQNVLPIGQSLVVRLAAGMCVNDIRVVFANGRAMERRGVNTCAITDLPLP